MVAAAGDPVTVFGVGSVINIGVTETLTPGDVFYVSATAGAISTSKIAANDVPFAKAVTATDIMIIREPW